MRIGVLLPNWVGDVVMSTPALRALREHYRGRARLTGIMRPYVAQVLAGTALLDDALLYHTSPSALQLFSNLRRQLRGQHFDELVLFTNSFLTALAARLTGAPRIWGYNRYFRGWLLTDRVVPRRAGVQRVPTSAVDYYLQLVQRMGCAAHGKRPELGTLPADEALAADFWQRAGLQPGKTIVLNTGGAYGRAKCWPHTHFAMLARMLVERLGTSVLVLCGPAEREAARTITRLADHESVVSLAEEKASIGLSKACVKRSQLMVTTDSGPRHFAAAFDIPAVTLFGPTDPRWSDNYHPQAVELRIPVDCGPCARRVCPLGHHRCMVELTPERVLQAVAQLWQATRPRQAPLYRTSA